jgi:hypothetical protein
MVSQIKKSGKKHGTCQLEECAKVLDAAKRLQSKVSFFLAIIILVSYF